MKILIVHNAGNSALPSGELKVVDDEFSALRKIGYSTHKQLIWNDDLGSLIGPKAIGAGLNLCWSYHSFRQTIELIDKINPDIVHFHSILPIVTGSALYACKSRGIPVAQTLHNFRWFCVEGGLFKNSTFCKECLDKGAFSGVVNRCLKRSSIVSALFTLNNLLYVKSGQLFKLIDCFIAVSNYVKNIHIKAGFPSDKIKVKYNSIDLKYPLSLNTSISEKNGITFVGRLSPSKGTMMLKEMITYIPDLQINIIGDGEDYDQLNNYCKEYERKNIIMHGKLDSKEVYDIMARSACVVIPSIFAETFGIVAVEAMACGTPIVANRIGGLAEIVEKSGGGLTVERNFGARGFIAAIRKVTSDKSRIKELGNKGRNFVRENYSIDDSIHHLVDIYRSLKRQKNSGTRNSF